jgi:tetratricopeptide (TPR) repeat protein
VLAQDEPDENVARLAAEAGRVHHFQGDNETAIERVEFALEIAERENYPRVLSDALNTKAIATNDRPNESRALLREALAIALDHDLAPQAIRAYNNLAVVFANEDRWEDARRSVEAGFELARARGDLEFTTSLGMGLVDELIWDGDWDGALALGEDLPLASQTAVASQAFGCISLARIAYQRSDQELAERWLARISPEVASSSDVQLQSLTRWRSAIGAMVEGRFGEALSFYMEAIEGLTADNALAQGEAIFNDAATIAADLGEPSLALPFAQFAEAAPWTQQTRPVSLACARIRGNEAVANGEHDRAADEFARGLAIGRNLGRPGLLAPLLFDYGRWLVQAGRSEDAAPLLDEARTMFEGMRATQWLGRLELVTGAPEAEAAVT